MSLVGIFAAATLTVDAGNLWQTRRNMVTATDAAALAEARMAALSDRTSCSAGTTADWIVALERNAGDDVQPESCTLVLFSSGAGYVQVEARKPVSYSFAPLFGASEGSAYSSTAVKYGYVSALMTGLRPFAFCDKSPDIQDYLAGGTGEPGHEPGVWHLAWSEGNPDACGHDAPGNWGWVDFDAGGSSTDAFKIWTLDGYSEETACWGGSGCLGAPTGTVEVGGCDTGHDVTACDGGTGLRESVPDFCGSNPGTTLSKAMTCLMESGQIFYVPIYSSVGCTSGGGSTCSFTISQFVAVRLKDFCLSDNSTTVLKCKHHPNPNGSPAELLAGNYFDLEILRRAIVRGPCCMSAPPGPADTGLRAIQICAVDHDPTPIGTQCAVS